MFTFLVLGSLGFWVLVGLASLLLLIFTELERPGLSTVTLVLSALAVWWFGDTNVFSLAWHHPQVLALFLGGYLLAGAVWTTIKWFLFVLGLKEDYLAAKAKYEKSPELYSTTKTPMPWEKSDARRFWRENDWRHRNSIPPQVSDHKSKVMLWLCYWPWSALWTLINDPIKRAFRAIYNAIHGLLQSISNKVFEDIK